jgi:hypothetical protein
MPNGGDECFHPSVEEDHLKKKSRIERIRKYVVAVKKRLDDI